jgi:exodeoxyribonuclease VII large subunit
VIYDAPLVDPLSPADVVLLDVRPSTVREVQPGDTVIAYGSIVTNFYKGQLKLKLRVDRLELAEPPEGRERRVVDLTVLDAVRQAGGVRHLFPNVPSPTVALLRSETSKVREDFLKALGWLRHELDIHEVSISMASPEDVAAAIRGVREEVMVLVRGGGDDTDFMVFETPQVLARISHSGSAAVPVRGG